MLSRVLEMAFLEGLVEVFSASLQGLCVAARVYSVGMIDVVFARASKTGLFFFQSVSELFFIL